MVKYAWLHLGRGRYSHRAIQFATSVMSTPEIKPPMGRLTRDPELRYTQSQTPVTSFRVAVDRDYTPKDGGERQADLQNPRILV